MLAEIGSGQGVGCVRSTASERLRGRWALWRRPPRCRILPKKKDHRLILGTEPGHKRRLFEQKWNSKNALRIGSSSNDKGESSKSLCLCPFSVPNHRQPGRSAQAGAGTLLVAERSSADHVFAFCRELFLRNTWHGAVCFPMKT